MAEFFFTITNYPETKFKEKGSSFIGRAFPVESTEEAEEKLEEIRKKFYDATHNCFAFKIREKDPRYSDDGEPSGTAGMRILNAINHFELENILVVVTRYFGGTKLGVGPLGKAYYNSAYDTLKSAEIVKMKNFLKMKAVFQYDAISQIHHFLSQHNSKIIENSFEENQPAIIFYSTDSEFENLQKDLVEATRGNIKLSKLDEEFLQIKKG
jgi:uncharacterized YigZ family protein